MDEIDLDTIKLSDDEKNSSKLQMKGSHL